MRTARDAPVPAAPRACAGTGLWRTRRRWRRCSRRRRPARSPACRSRRGRASLARRRVRHLGDRRGQVPVPYSHPTRCRPWADPRHARCSSPPPGCPQPTRRTWCGTCRPVQAGRCAAPPRHLAQADPPAAMTLRQPHRPGRRAECGVSVRLRLLVERRVESVDDKQSSSGDAGKELTRWRPSSPPRCWRKLGQHPAGRPT